jgi:hypothetical protein
MNESPKGLSRFHSKITSAFSYRLYSIESSKKIQELLMRRSPVSFIFYLFMVMAAAMPAAAWDDVGHKITGYIAWQRMSPATRANVIRILRAAPEDSQLATFYLGYGPRTTQAKMLDYFLIVPTWADIIRDRAFPVRNEKYHRGTWHYSDTLWRQIDGKVVIATDIESSGQGVAKLFDFDKAMRDAALTDADRAIAVAWFLHIGGDLHQPLHTSGRITESEPKGDQGANLFLLTPEGAPRERQTNLHAFWDGIVGRNVPYRDAQAEDDYVRIVAESMMAKYPFAGLAADLKLGRFDEWQKESFELATTDVFRSDLMRFETPSDDYRRNAYRVSEQRLAIAGYRMGETLEQIFGERSAAASECRVIRKIMYPISKRESGTSQPEPKPTLALLDICPEGPAARPTLMVTSNGGRAPRAFDVIRIFETEDAARSFARQNSIKDVSFEVQ